jgi:hypothetical protein
MLVCIEAAIDGCVKVYGKIRAAFLTNFWSFKAGVHILGRS